MGKRGPKPKARAPKASASKGSSWVAPGHLTGDSLEAWNHVVRILTAAGTLERTDPTLVEAYAMTVATMRAAHACIEAEGLTIANRWGTLTANPAAAVLNSATSRIKSMTDALGLNPSTAHHAGESEEKDPAEDGWRDYLSVG